MDEPDNEHYAERDPFDRFGALVGPWVDELRSVLDDVSGRWRGDAIRLSEGTRHRLRDVLREVGVITRNEFDELELRVAQLEHRIRLLEDDEPA